MGYLLWIGGIVLAIWIAKSKNRNTLTWGALALVIPLLSVLILLCLGKKKTQHNNGVIDDEID